MEERVSHVLYVSMECKVCHALRGKGFPFGVRVENVADIIPRPAWLDGTPTLVDVSVGVLYKGSDALIVLDHMRQTQTQQQAQEQAQQAAQQRAIQNQAQQQQQQRAVQQGPSVPSRPPPRQAAPQPQARPALEPAVPATGAKTASWKSLFNTDLSDVAEEPTPGKINEASIAEMMSRRSMKTSNDKMS
jgi:hypothetical protein